MRLEFKPQAFEDLQYWVANQPKIAKRILRIIEECSRTPYEGIGKPEPLKGEFSGWWSRRIDAEHRLIYQVSGDSLVIAQARWHYKN